MINVIINLMEESFCNVYIYIYYIYNHHLYTLNILQFQLYLNKARENKEKSQTNKLTLHFKGL